MIKEAFEKGNPDAPSTDQSNIDVAKEIAIKTPGISSPKVAIPGAAASLPTLDGHAPAQQNELQAYQVQSGSYIFVSNSMTDKELRDAFEVAADTGSIIFYRGVENGLPIQKAFIRPHQIASTLKVYPEIQLDPRPFKEYDIQTVPTVVVSDGSEFVKVSGTLSVSYAAARLKNNQYGDAGSRGTSRAISEPDLMDDIANRISKIDFNAKKDAAIARFWTNQKFVNLPRTNENKAVYFDPTVVNEDEIRDPNGNLIAPAGASFNPLDIVNFSKSIVIFDATDKKQLEFAKRYSAKKLEENRGTILITTNVNTDDGFKAMAGYNEYVFPNRVFLLDELVASRFGVKVVPSVINAEGRLFRIDQIAYSAL